MTCYIKQEKQLIANKKRLWSSNLIQRIKINLLHIGGSDVATQCIELQGTKHIKQWYVQIVYENVQIKVVQIQCIVNFENHHYV